jgi:hypothetical protein
VVIVTKKCLQGMSYIVLYLSLLVVPLFYFLNHIMVTVSVISSYTQRFVLVQTYLWTLHYFIQSMNFIGLSFIFVIFCCVDICCFSLWCMWLMCLVRFNTHIYYRLNLESMTFIYLWAFMITGKVSFIAMGMNMTKERCNRRKTVCR